MSRRIPARFFRERWSTYHATPSDVPNAVEREYSHPYRCAFCHFNMRNDFPFAHCQKCPFVVCSLCARLLDSTDSAIHTLVASATGERLTIEACQDPIHREIIVSRPRRYYGKSERLCRVAPLPLTANMSNQTV